MAASQKSGKKSAAKKTSTISKKVGLIFPVGRVRSMLKKGRYTKRVGAAAPVYLTAVLEYLTAELLELSGKVAAQHKKKRITPRAVTLAVRHDDELSQLLGNVTFSQGGVAPNLHDALQKKSKSKTSSQQV
ncbi:histone h2a [Perkinsela sp. CCAP 1560/4]|nr:histone h2a [Perkinsela sp. CCAP 1560/4]|eukprot:KNH04995.1 histone h2a [Perkinsela sp. CCAP 1560/4]